MRKVAFMGVFLSFFGVLFAQEEIEKLDEVIVFGQQIPKCDKIKCFKGKKYFT